VGRACQNGELTEKASSSGRNVRAAFAQAIAASGESTPDVDVEAEDQLALGHPAHVLEELEVARPVGHLLVLVA
jgi:hypothetical protein